jgi:hypothetical protein
MIFKTSTKRIVVLDLLCLVRWNAFVCVCVCVCFFRGDEALFEGRLKLEIKINAINMRIWGKFFLVACGVGVTGM